MKHRLWLSRRALDILRVLSSAKGKVVTILFGDCQGRRGSVRSVLAAPQNLTVLWLANFPFGRGAWSARWGAPFAGRSVSVDGKPPVGARRAEPCRDVAT